MVRGPRSLAVSQFHRVNTTSYSSLVEIMSVLYCFQDTAIKFFVESHRLRLHLAPCWGDLVRISTISLALENWIPKAVTRRFFHDLMFTDRISVGGNAITSVRPFVSTLYLSNRLTTDLELLRASRS